MINRLFSLLLAAVPSIAMGAPDLAFQDLKRHRQIDLDSTRYLTGNVFVGMVDGAIFIAGCADHPSASVVQPYIFCPLGTTGFIAVGDVDGDGAPDDGSFWSISSIEPASNVEPFEVDRVSIIAAPPSGISALLRNSRGDISAVFDVRDFSVVTWYDFINFPVEEFVVTRMLMDRPYGVIPPLTNQWVDVDGEEFTGDIIPDPADVMANPPAGDPLHTVDIPVGDPMLRIDTLYGSTKPFNFDFQVPDLARALVIPRFLQSELERQYFDVPWGTYLFEFPRLGDPLREDVYGVNLLNSPDIYPGRSRLPQGWRLINTDWYLGHLEVDPRIFYDFIWEGINFQNTVSNDNLFLSMRANQWIDATTFLTKTGLEFPDIADIAVDPLTGQLLFREDVVIFPPYPFATPVPDREPFLLGVFDGHYQLGPFFFQPGESAMGELDFRRDLNSGAATRDVSRRFLEFEIQFIDTFEGFSFFSAPLMVGGFPFGTPTSERTANKDLDGDGYSNFCEYAFQSDLADSKVFPSFTFDAVDLGDGVGSCTATVDKRPSVGSSLRYEFEFSSDGMMSWTTIKPGGIWDIDVTPETLTVTNNALVPGDGSCFLRVRATQH